MRIIESKNSLLVMLLVTFVGLSWLVNSNSIIQPADGAIYQLSKNCVGPLWLWINQVISFFGTGALLISLSFVGFVYCCVRSRVYLGIWYFLSVIIALQTNSALKVFFLRPRPVGFDPTTFITSSAYPSGHALGITVFGLLSWWVAKQLAQPKSSWVFLPWIMIVVVGASRVFLGVHWASDVVGGVLFGLIWVLAVRQLAPPNHRALPQ